MNIAERFNEKKRLEKQGEENRDNQKLRKLANCIMTAMSDKETVESIENYLAEKGCVHIKDFGCLCQDGFCDWQKGLDVLLKPLVQEWKEKGVKILLSLKMIMYVEHVMYPKVMTIEQLKEWNRSYKGRA